MNKRLHTIEVTQKKTGDETNKKLYRTITDHTKQLDDAKSCARYINDLFKPLLIIKRRKLCDYCERLLYIDPLLYGKKCEDIIWRKVYYDVVSMSKQMKNNNKGINYTEEELLYLENHIYSGIGFYHHMISKLQITFNLNIENFYDFPIISLDDHKETDDKLKEWALQSLHQCLLYLGDLNRYKYELKIMNDKNVPIRYYMHAISLKPDNGVPYNQMGTLAMNQNDNLEAVYYYLKCLSCKFTFDGTINNLTFLFDKNSKYIEQLQQENTKKLEQFIARFLLLIDIWYFNKKIQKVNNLCHLTIKDLNDCLYNLKENEENDINDEILLKITIICILCWDKLKITNSTNISTVNAFILALYSQLIQKIINNIEINVLNYPSVNKKHKKLRRRKNFNDETDSTDTDDDEIDLSLSEDEEEFLSDEEDELESSGDELTTTTTKPESKDKKQEDILRKIKITNVNDMIDIITEENLLKCIKILNDWLSLDKTLIKSCNLNTPKLIEQIVYLLNLINVNNFKNCKNLNGIEKNLIDLNNIEKIPLNEDLILRGLKCFEKNGNDLYDWNYYFNKKNSLNVKEESLIRIMKFNNFGKFLMEIEEIGILYDEKKRLYSYNKREDLTGSPDEVTKNIPEQNKPTMNGKIKDTSMNSNHFNGGQLLKMKHMGQLWLASEVSALENKFKGKSSLSPYLVLDADALITYNFMVKQLVNSRKFIVLVPHAVVSALDDLKREKPEARDAIRWLEMQFHQGNRFFRSQRPQERSSIPFVKYPKKKNKEMLTYIQIIECCYYFLEQQKGVKNLVTLLIGNHNLTSNGEKEFSYVGLAQSAGIDIELITEFYAKSNKGNR